VLTVKNYGVRMIPVDYNCESKIDLTIHPHGTQELKLSLKPLIRDIGKQIQVSFSPSSESLLSAYVRLLFSVFPFCLSYKWRMWI